MNLVSKIRELSALMKQNGPCGAFPVTDPCVPHFLPVEKGLVSQAFLKSRPKQLMIREVEKQGQRRSSQGGK